MAFHETHPLVATQEEIADSQNRPTSVEGECAQNGNPSEFHIRSIRAISETVFSEDDGPMDTARLDWLVKEYVDFMSRAPAKQRLLFRLAAMVVGLVGPILIMKLTSFSSLSFSDRILALRKLESRPIGKILIPLRAILCLIYYEHPDAAAQLQLHDQPKHLVGIGRQ